MVRLLLGPTLAIVVLASSPLGAQVVLETDGQHQRLSVRSLPAIVEPVEEVVICPPFDGVVMEALVVAGQQVRAGEVIGRMDNRVPLAALHVAEQAADNDAKIRSAETQLEMAKRLANRIKLAHQRNAASELELDRAVFDVVHAEVALDDARAEQKRLQAHLKLARAECDQFCIVAPFSGTVLQTFVSPGQAVVRGEELFHLANLDQLQADLQIDTDYFGQLTVGNVYHLTAGIPVNRRIAATLTFVEPRVDAASQTFRCRFHFRNENQSLPIGFAVSFDPRDAFETENGQAALRVPRRGISPIVHDGDFEPWSELLRLRQESRTTPVSRRTDRHQDETSALSRPAIRANLR